MVVYLSFLPPQANGKGLLKLLTPRIVWNAFARYLFRGILQPRFRHLPAEYCLEKTSLDAVRQLDFFLVELKGDFFTTYTSP